MELSWQMLGRSLAEWLAPWESRKTPAIADYLPRKNIKKMVMFMDFS
jgi:hypothetical protein